LAHFIERNGKNVEVTILHYIFTKPVIKAKVKIGNTYEEVPVKDIKEEKTK